MGATCGPAPTFRLLTHGEGGQDESNPGPRHLEYDRLLSDHGHSALICGDTTKVLESLPGESVQTVVTSPPYWSLRNYGIDGQIGLEDSVEEFIKALTLVFDQVRRVLRKDGTLWLNIGDSYTSGGRTWRAPDKKNRARAMDVRPPTPDGLKPKDLIGVPWRLAFALQASGWYLRSDIIWNKPNCQPESVTDRPTRGHEYLFLLSKSERYFYDVKAVPGPNGRRLRSVWDVKTQAVPEANGHFATFPSALVEPCVRSGSHVGDIVLDPFAGSGTTALVAGRLERRFVGIELQPEYLAIADRRLRRAGFVVAEPACLAPGGGMDKPDHGARPGVEEDGHGRAEVFLAIHEVVEPHLTKVTETSLIVQNAAGRRVRVVLASDPDVAITEEFVDGEDRLNVAIEIKGGTDRSNAHNRAGEAEKSHQKVRSSARDFWTIIAMKGVEKSQLATESPTTRHWYDVAEVLGRAGGDWEAFKNDLKGAIGI